MYCKMIKCDKNHKGECCLDGTISISKNGICEQSAMKLTVDHVIKILNKQSPHCILLLKELSPQDVERIADLILKADRSAIGQCLTQYCTMKFNFLMAIAILEIFLPIHDYNKFTFEQFNEQRTLFIDTITYLKKEGKL